MDVVMLKPAIEYVQSNLFNNGQDQVSTLQMCPYQRGRECIVWFLAFLGPNELSVIERCPYYRGVGKERLDGSFFCYFVAGRPPLGQMPFIVTPEGKTLAQSGAILKYICKKGGKQNYIL